MSERLRVLLVEDNPADVDLIREMLPANGSVIFRLECVSRLADALAVLQGGGVDLVLLDLGLPDSQGLATFQRVKEAAPEVPLVVLTGNDDEEAAIAAVKQGAQDYLIKGQVVGNLLARAARYAIERKRAEEALRESERKLKEAQRLGRMGHWGIDLETRQLDWSDTVFTLYERDPTLGPPTAEDEAAYYSPEDAEKLRAAARRTVETGDPYEIDVRLRLPGGRHADVVAIGAAVRDRDGDVVGLAGTVQDITKRRAMDESLRESQERYRAVTQSATDAIVTIDSGGSIVGWNKGAEQVFGYTQGEVVGQLVVVLMPLRYRQPHLDGLKRVAAGGERKAIGRSVELEGQRKDGSEFPVELSLAAWDISNGRYYSAIIRDVSERKRTEEALRRLEADYRGLVEHAPLGIYRSSADGRFVTVNRALVEMLGYESADEVLRLDIPREVYADPEQRADLVARFRSEDEATTEAQWQCKDGSLITVQLNVRIVRTPTGQIEYFEGLVEDVTQQRSLENQFRQAQKMEAVGRLAGGVAHDFNNILTIIVSNSEFLLGDLGTDDPKRQDVEEIRAAAQRATGLTRQLLAFSRRQVLQLRVLSLNGVVEALNKMLLRLIGEDVTLEASLDSELGAVRADAGQMEQVILNLVVNSRDAMPSGGRLTIETSNVVLDEAYVREHTGVSPGRYAMLAISDTGVGMDAETQAHIFEPFFTTKELGKGTGLGLATVYGIVKQCRGFVWVYSEPGRGTTFKIYLPRVDAPLDAPDMAQPVRPSPGGHEFVLLAEDDASVRRVIAEALERKGYRVLAAPDGQTAVAMARAQPGEIPLLITDLVMPGMTGRELAETIAAERPQICVLYMSGYTDDAVVRHGVLEAGMLYLQKPFTPGALAFKVREALDLCPSA